MSLSWNIEAFRESLRCMDQVRDSFGDEGFVKITDMRDWEGGTREGLDFDTEKSPTERSPEATVIVVSNSFQKRFMKRHLDEAIAGKHPIFIRESIEEAIGLLEDEGYLEGHQADEVRQELTGGL